MQDPETLTTLRDTLQFLVGSDIPSKHKAVLLDTLVQALRREEAAQTAAKTAEPAAQPWQADETARLQSFLEGKVAISWQHADEMLMRLVWQLHRTASDIRMKAKQLGLSAGIDYALAKVRPQASDK